jgi:hypothetical protein
LHTYSSLIGPLSVLFFTFQIPVRFVVVVLLEMGIPILTLVMEPDISEAPCIILFVHSIECSVLRNELHTVAEKAIYRNGGRDSDSI